jgi:LysR family transcriptional regulator, chromosome initiation inhibitor
MANSFDPDQLAALAAAVSEGTFEAAARRLHVTPSAVSQRIKALETAVGRILLTRSKPIEPTASGRTLLRAARQIEAITGDAARELGDELTGEPQVIQLAVNADSLETWLMPALAAAGGPAVFDLRRDDQTRTAEMLRDGTVMAAVTASAEPVPGCIVEPLGRMRYRSRAQAAFVHRWLGAGATVTELSRAPVVCFDREDLLQDRYLRRRARRRLEPPRHYVPGSGAFVEAVVQGLGWGMVPDLQAGPGTTGEELIAFDDRGVIDVRLFWQQWRLRSPALDRVASAVRAQAAAALR